MSVVPVIRRNSIYSFLAFSFRLVANAVLFVGIARFYGAAAFGQFSLAHVYFSIMIFVADFGYDFFTATEIGRDVSRTPEIARAVLPMKIYLGGLSVVLMVVLAMVGQSDNTIRALMVILALGVPVNSFMTFAAAVFRGNQDILPEARVSFTQNALLLVFLVVIAFLKLPISVVACGFVVSKAYGFVSLWMAARKRFPGVMWTFRLPPRESAKAMLGNGLTFGTHLLFAALCLQLDTILLAYLAGQGSVAQYQAVMKLAVLVLVLNEVAIASVIPVLAQAFESDAVRWLRVGTVVSKCLHLVGGFFGVLFVISPEQILSLVYGSGTFAPSVPVMRIFGLILLVRFGMETFAMMLTSSKRQLSRTIVVILATVGNALTNLMVIPRFGIVGAAWVSLGTNAFIAVAYVGLVSFLVRHRFPLIDLRQIMIFAGFAGLGTFLWMVGLHSLVIVVPAALVVAVGLTYVGFSKNEQAILSAFFSLAPHDGGRVNVC